MEEGFEDDHFLNQVILAFGATQFFIVVVVQHVMGYLATSYAFDPGSTPH